jgi:hypothetical protein
MRFAKELAITVPKDRLEEVTTLAKQHGPRRPAYWIGLDWKGILDLEAYIQNEKT